MYRVIVIMHVLFSTHSIFSGHFLEKPVILLRVARQSRKSGILLMLLENMSVKYDNIPITEVNLDLVTSLNLRNCHLTTFCAVSFIMS